MAKFVANYGRVIHRDDGPADKRVARDLNELPSGISLLFATVLTVYVPDPELLTAEIGTCAGSRSKGYYQWAAVGQ